MARGEPIYTRDLSIFLSQGADPKEVREEARKKLAQFEALPDQSEGVKDAISEYKTLLLHLDDTIDGAGEEPAASGA